MSLRAASLAPLSAERRWWLIDVRGQRVGRAATEIARLLNGKHKPIFAPAIDVGDHVVVVNASQVELTGKKWQQKYLTWHTGYPGGLKRIKAKEFHKRWPTWMLQWAVFGMLGSNTPTRNARKRRLHLYEGPAHDHSAQAPVPYALLDTKKPDLTANWNEPIPQWRMTFERVSSADPWVVTLDEPRVTRKDQKAMRAARAQGRHARHLSSDPHPEGFVRGGTPRHGRRW